MTRKQCRWIGPARLLMFFSLALSSLPAVRGEDFFQQHVAPIIAKRCLTCHDSVNPKGDLALHNSAALLAGNYVEPGDAAASQLMQLLTPDENGLALMPQDADPLSTAERAAIATWINAGAVWPGDFEIAREIPAADFDWWSYQPLKRPAVPDIHDPWAQSAIDRFVRATQIERGLGHSPPADRRTLIRRLTYDLIGLPPSPEEVAAFESDTDPRAYERLVERLLESEHYGERWARHWLDVAKYADTCGYDKDKLRPNAWPYRDYVIRSLNTDKPYARFVQEQIAGDVLFPDEADGIVGLGFIAAGPWDFIGHVEVSETKLDGKVARNLDRDDMVAGALNTFCSLTVQCARCHDHKFDAITQEQYYGLQAIFAAVDRADRKFDTDPALTQRRRALTAKRAELVAQRNELDVANLIRWNSGRPLADQRYSGYGAPKFAIDLQPATASSTVLLDRALSRVSSGELEQRRRALALQIANLQAELEQLPPPQKVYAAATHFDPQGNFKPTYAQPREVFVLTRGEVDQPGPVAVPGVVPLSAGSTWQFAAGLSEAERRGQLAHWLTDHEHPLVWRSIVNRVWQYHFGEGIVSTPNDFGRMGAQPTHPELLDWLAVEFRDGGQSLKSLHRLIVTSNTYRQSAEHNTANAAIDGSNQFLWRANRRRLSAEELRDSILTVSGAMNWQMGGPGYYLFELEKPEHSPHFEYHKFDPADKASHRRSIYSFIARSQPNPYLTTLDCADSSQSTPRRLETLTSLQALALLNNKFNLAMAEEFAGRLQQLEGSLDAQVERAMWLVTQRAPTPIEQQELVVYADTHGLTNLCRLLFNLSEFVFVD